MYAPPNYRENRPEILLGLIRDVGFAALAVCKDGDLTVAHIPMVANTAETPLVLEGHVARGNEAWTLARDGATAIATFQGPHAYVHPGWYETKRETGQAVPTWNYAVVQARGQLTSIEEPTWLRAHLERLTTLNENGRAEPWSISDTPEDYMQRLMRGLVGLRLEVETLEGSWKMGQGRSTADRQGVINGLTAEPGHLAHDVSAIMAERLRGEET